MRVLHLSDRLTRRGGAYVDLLRRLEREVCEREVHLAVGRIDADGRAPCETSVVAGLDARTRAPVELETLMGRFRPDVVRVENVVNPEALETVGRLDGVEKVAIVQDHRFFCPGKGKWTSSGEVCREPMSLELCASCFDEETYFREIFALTEERLRALAAFRVEVLSEYMKRELVAAGVPEERVRVVPPVARLQPGDSWNAPRCVLFVGRLVEAKGVWDAVDAWRRAGVPHPLVFAGTGPLRADLAEQGFEVLGWVPHERMLPLYQRAVCVLLPSRWQEPFGIAGLEAASVGTPVVAWESGGVAEWSDSARRIPWGDVEALAAELARVCEDAHA